jgi:hypothetical protein
MNTRCGFRAKYGAESERIGQQQAVFAGFTGVGGFLQYEASHPWITLIIDIRRLGERRNIIFVRLPVATCRSDPKFLWGANGLTQWLVILV